MSTKRTAEHYKQMDPVEHVLKRPDTYIGSIESASHQMYVLEDGKMNLKTIEVNLGFIKIIDELLVNARDAAITDNASKTIKVTCNDNKIIIYNDGLHLIPVEMHPEYNKYVPTMIFGELLTGSNFNDDDNRETGGRNGIGATSANIFSKVFKIVIDDINNKLRFVQSWHNNMSIVDPPKISPLPKNIKYSSVAISIEPDYEKFGLECLSDIYIQLFEKRTYEIAATTPNIKVYFNNIKIPVINFQTYVELYQDTGIFYDLENTKWKIAAGYVENIPGYSISFVNGIATYQGGTHVNYIYDIICKTISKMCTKHKIMPSAIKERLILFVSAIIINPGFSTQNKTQLITKSDKFTKYEPSQIFIKKLFKSGIIENIVDSIKQKEANTLKKSDGKKQIRILGYPKLEDAIKAGTTQSHKCTLILTEGDSAKATAMAGISILERTFYGVFPLKGKLLNVRDASMAIINNNDEIKALKQIIGLKENIDYSNDTLFNTLRYGNILLMTDSDEDGSHIKGLVMNFFHSKWPSLIERSFIKSLRTPIVKAVKGSTVISFYNLRDYHVWLNTNSTKTFNIKYYKGLGTSTATEAKEYFKNYNTNLINYVYEDNNDAEALILAFDKNKSNERKTWLMTYDANLLVDTTKQNIRYYDFVHLELKHFSNSDLHRSIPYIIDGLKPSQRKIIYGALEGGLDKTELKVSQLAGIVSHKAAYHHGEASLMAAIIGLAQDFVGSNNINILKPNGQFGCLSPDTKVIKWNGEIVFAKDIVVGDELIGDDGNKRTVLQTTSGFDTMYEIIIENQFSYIVNKEHYLTLYFEPSIFWNSNVNQWELYYFDKSNIKLIKIPSKCNSCKEYLYYHFLKTKLIVDIIYAKSSILDIKVKDFIQLPNYVKTKFKSISNYNVIKWDHKIIDGDPYIIGTRQMKKIPNKYLINTEDVRLEVLAGYIDTYGVLSYLNDKCYITIQYSLDNINDIKFLCRSLGLITEVKFINLLAVFGNLNIVPFRKLKLTTNNFIYKNFKSFRVKIKEYNSFVGWQVDGNERFLLENFIITHNSRLVPSGKDSASPRYIWTCFEPISKIIFSPEDLPILKEQFEDNMKIEPVYYAPIIPMVLVNGADGIGTGFSTKIPCFNPLDIIANLKRLLNDEDLVDILPWFRGFKGTVEKVDENYYNIYGKWELNNDILVIKELPIGEWISSYKELLEKKLSSYYESYQDFNTHEDVHFIIKLIPGYDPTAIPKIFHLIKKISTTNMHLYNAQHTITKYNSVLDIIKEYYNVRLALYEERRQHKIQCILKELEVIRTKIRFIELIMSDELVVFKQSKKDIINNLNKLNFPNNSHEYLLPMPIHSFTIEKINDMKKILDNLETTYNMLLTTNNKLMWLEELNVLESYLK